MRKLLTHLVTATGIGMAAFAVSLTSAGQAVAQGIKPILVQVINSSAEAVPVTGLVRVANAAGAPLETRDASDFAARNAFSEEIRLQVTNAASDDFTIPPGKRLVVECVSVQGSDTQDGFEPRVTLRTIVGQTQADYVLTPPLVDRSSVLQLNFFAGTQSVRFYADALRISISRAVGNWDVTVSGYLVDQP